jgi:hypothetical protein
MTYVGHIQNGAVVLDGPLSLPEGAKVFVSSMDFLEEDAPEDNTGPTLFERLEAVLGTATGLPPDACGTPSA